jgi:hypothetical protein
MARETVETRELKLRQVWTQGVHMKGVLPWLVRWAGHAITRDFCPALASLVGLVQKIFFHHLLLFHFICSHRPVSWACSHAESPVSLSMCLCR